LDVVAEVDMISTDDQLLLHHARGRSVRADIPLGHLQELRQSIFTLPARFPEGIPVIQP
jgi:hypothetical protein